jgi:chromosome segregation ATPase
MDISPEQKAHLETWAGQRDLLLSEISSLQTQKESLIKDVQEIAASYTDIETRATQYVGRIEELSKKEKELIPLMTREVSDLKVTKSILETEITNLNKEISALIEQKASLEKDVSSAIANFDILKSEAMVLDKIVDHVTVVSDENSRKINELVTDLSKSLEEMVAVNKKNVFETNLVLDKLPKMIMEAQRHGLIKNKI